MSEIVSFEAGAWECFVYKLLTVGSSILRTALVWRKYFNDCGSNVACDPTHIVDDGNRHYFKRAKKPRCELDNPPPPEPPIDDGGLGIAFGQSSLFSRSRALGGGTELAEGTACVVGFLSSRNSRP